MGGKKAISVWHRRAGKDVAAMIIAMICAFEDPGTYWHVFPTYAQGKKALWDGIDSEGRKFTSWWPKSAIVSARNDEMKMELEIPQSDGTTRSSIYQVIGGDQVDRAVGTNPKGIILSEFSLMNPMVPDILGPIVEENNGWMIFPYTPRGSNHGLDLLNMAKKNGWFWEVLDIGSTQRTDGSSIVTPRALRADQERGDRQGR